MLSEGSTLHSADVLCSSGMKKKTAIYNKKTAERGLIFEIALSGGLPFPFHSLTGSEVLSLVQKLGNE